MLNKLRCFRFNTSASISEEGGGKSRQFFLRNYRFSKLPCWSSECNALNLESVSSVLGESVMLFNGRCGLEFPDNQRAGASGLIPGFDTVDKTS